MMKVVTDGVNAVVTFLSSREWAQWLLIVPLGIALGMLGDKWAGIVGFLAFLVGILIGMATLARAVNRNIAELMGEDDDASFAGEKTDTAKP